MCWGGRAGVPGRAAPRVAGLFPRLPHQTAFNRRVQWLWAGLRAAARILGGGGPPGRLAAVHWLGRLVYRVALEAILGLRVLGDHFWVDPTVPSAWSSFELRYRRGGTTYTVLVENPDGVSHGVRPVELDGSRCRPPRSSCLTMADSTASVCC